MITRRLQNSSSNLFLFLITNQRRQFIVPLKTGLVTQTHRGFKVVPILDSNNKLDKWNIVDKKGNVIESQLSFLDARSWIDDNSSLQKEKKPANKESVLKVTFKERTEPLKKTAQSFFYTGYMIVPKTDKEGNIKKYEIMKANVKIGLAPTIEKVKAKIDEIEGKLVSIREQEKKTVTINEMGISTIAYRVYKRWTLDQVKHAASKINVPVLDDKKVMILAMIKKVGDDYDKVKDLFR